MNRTQQLDQKSIAHLIAQCPFPELAAVLRSEAKKIVWRWMAAVRSVVPSATDLPADELRSQLPEILEKMADVMESANRQSVDNLIQNSLAQGLARLQQRYDVGELMIEGRLLRRVIIEQAGAALGRRMCEAEQVALNMAIDLMLQQAVVAYMDEQKGQLRAVVEAELKYLLLLSHDPNNNLGNIRVMLEWIRKRLETSTDLATDVETPDAVQQSILHTISGTLRQDERLAQSGVRPQQGSFRLDQLASNAVLTLAKKAEAKGVRIVMEMATDVVIHNNGELIGLILQNLLGNAVRFSPEGTIWVRAVAEPDECVISVTDEGPGVAVEHIDRLFDSSRRRTVHPQPGVGLGLTIASQAARLLEGELSVESKVGVGSTFFLRFPLRPHRTG